MLIEKPAKYGVAVLSSRDPDSGTTRFVRFELALLPADQRAALRDAKRGSDIRDYVSPEDGKEKKDDPSGVFALLNDVIDGAEAPAGWTVESDLDEETPLLPGGEVFGLFNDFYYG